MSAPSPPRLVLVADHAYLGDDAAWLQAVDRAAGAVAALPETGPQVWIQLRGRKLTGRRRRRLLVEARDAAGDHGVPLILNGDTDEALELGFAGVHWPEATIPSPAATPPLPTGFRRCASVHSTEAALRARDAGAGLVVFGPVFSPGSKPGRGVGLEPLSRVATGVPLPVLAIGGIDHTAVRQCLAAGAAGVAVVSAVFGPGRETATEIRRLVARLPHRPGSAPC